MEILNSILIILAFSIAILYLCHYVHLPTLVGYLVTGTLIGPYGLGLIHDVHMVEVLAEIGVILLLFTIGLEFSLSRLLQIKRLVLMGGGLQVGLTIAAVFGLGWLIMQQAWNTALAFGFFIALSSTAIVLKLLQERGEIEAPHGRASLGILIFQDLAMVPLLLFIPLLSQSSGSPVPMLLELALKGGAILLLVVFGAKWAVPRLLYGIVKTRNRELFLVSIVVLCFGVAWLTSAAGLSLALGAFLAGIIISESEYSHEALANILPFRDLFSSFFFISIGMLLNIQFVAANLAAVGAASLGVVLLKALILCAVGLLIGYPLRIAVMIGLALAQVGEFSFVLAKAGVEAGLLNGQSYQLFLAVSVVSMVASPFAIAAAPAAARRLMRVPLFRSLHQDDTPLHESDGLAKEGLSNHILIIGYGPAGKHAAQAARTWDIPFVIIEMNPVTVRQVGREGMPIVFGDATHEAVLERTGIHQAKMAVIVISDPPAVREVTKLCRELNPELYIIGRTRFLQEINVLQGLGANAVVSEEMEASIEILSRLLSHYYIPGHEVEAFIRELRAQGYTALRDELENIRSACDLELPNVDIERILLEEQSPGAGRTILELGLRKNYGVTLLAVRRKGRIISNPGPETRLLPGDVVLAVGTTKDLARVSNLFHVSAARRPH